MSATKERLDQLLEDPRFAELRLKAVASSAINPNDSESAIEYKGYIIDSHDDDAFSSVSDVDEYLSFIRK